VFIRIIFFPREVEHAEEVGFMPLTRRQRDVLDFLTAYVRERGCSPSYGEIAEHLGCRSISTVHEHVRNLAAKGRVRVELHKKRSIEVVESREQPREYTPIFPPRRWLHERCGEYALSPRPELDTTVPAIRRSRERWHAIRSRMRAGDELWTFCAPEANWRDGSGRAGYALLRAGEVVDGVVTHDPLQLGELPEKS
jgi:hypothetical protein